MKTFSLAANPLPVLSEPSLPPEYDPVWPPNDPLFEPSYDDPPLEPPNDPEFDPEFDPKDEGAGPASVRPPNEEAEAEPDEAPRL